MKVIDKRLVAAAALALQLMPALAHAECGAPAGGLTGFIESILDVFRSKKIKFDASSRGVSYTGEIEVKGVSCGSTTLNVRLTAAAQAAAEGSRGPVGGGIDVRTGVATEYELTLPNSEWERTNVPPNPLDPASLPPGGSMVLRREYFASLGLEAHYRQLVVAAGYEEGAGVVVAVQRDADGKTRLIVGPYEVVKNEMMVGVGEGDYSIGLGRDDKLENGRLRSWTFDPNNPEDVRAYQSAFAQSVAVGSVPFTDRPSETIEYVTYDSQTGVRIGAGPISFGGNFGQGGADLRFVTHADGTVTASASNNHNGVQLDQVREYSSAPPNGRQVGQDQITVSFTESDHQFDYLYQAVTGQQTVPPGGFKIDLNNENWQQWRDRAREYIAAHPDQRYGFPLEDLANANGPMDVAQILYTIGTNNVTSDTMPILLAALYDANNGGDRNPTIHPFPGYTGPACPNATGAPSDAQTRATSVAQRWCGSNVDLFAQTTMVPIPTYSGVTGGAVGAGMARH